MVRAVRVHVCNPSIRKVGTERPGFEARFSYIRTELNKIKKKSPNIEWGLS